MISIPTIVVNCKHLLERRESIVRQLEGKIIDYMFYLEYDKADLTEEMINHYYSDDDESQQQKLELWKPQLHKSRRLNLAEISLTIKHYEILRLISESTHDAVMVLEDDVILCDDFVNRFKMYMEQTPPDYDMIFLGSGAGLRPDNLTESKFAYLKNHPASKCTDSYIITKKASSKLASTYLPFNLCVDFEMAYHMFTHNLNVYWWDPPLIQQGSETGAFSSELR